MAETQAQARPRDTVASLTRADVEAALRAGLADFRRAPAFGLFFGGVYVLLGLIGVTSVVATGQTIWAVTMITGFPLIAPFAAVGLYEVSRRLEQGEPLRWPEVLGVVWSSRAGQLPWFGALMVVWFMFYAVIAHLVFALVLGPSALVDMPSSLSLLGTPRGFGLILVEVLIGSVFAATVFTACVISLPMMLDREVDFVTALVTSVRTVLENPVTMAFWAVLVAAALVVGMLPAFLGLFVVLPVLGHGTWHLYRRALIA